MHLYALLLSLGIRRLNVSLQATQVEFCWLRCYWSPFVTIAFTAEVASGAVVARGSDGFYALATAQERLLGKDKGHVRSSLQTELNSLLPRFSYPPLGTLQITSCFFQVR